MSLTYIVITGFIAAMLLPLFSGKRMKAILGWTAALVPIALFVNLLGKAPEVISGEAVRETMEWFPSLGISLAFYLDSLSLLFALIITGIGFVVFFYAGAYMKGDKHTIKFFVYLMLFMASMLGVVLADNLITIFIFWELTSITSYFLIGFKHDYEKSRDSALQALLVTGLGGIALLAAMLLLQVATGEHTISGLLSSGLSSGADTYVMPVIILLFLAAFTKSAQFPFHFWLPNAMAAPTPVSAYLHSATMVKAGVYLAARFNPLFSGNDLWSYGLTITGALTMLIGAYLSLPQRDLKLILAYSTVSILGTLTMLIGIGTKYALAAMGLYLLAHSLYKAALFLTAGSIDHQTGTRDTAMVGGLRKVMPFNFIVGLVSALSMMGVIPLLGFIGKETLYEALLAEGIFMVMLITIAILSNIALAAVAVKAGIKPYTGTYLSPKEGVRETAFRMWFGPLLLAGLSLVLGLFSGGLLKDIISGTAAAQYGSSVEFTPALWHGFNLVLALSVVTLLAGIGTVYLIPSIERLSEKYDINRKSFVKPSEWYEYALSAVKYISALQTKILQNGYLRYYLMIILATLLLTGGYIFFASGILSSLRVTFEDFPALMILLPVFIVGVAVILFGKSRLFTILALGIIGFAVAFIFILYGAPDLALTQFAIETLTVILFVLVIFKMPKYKPFSKKVFRLRDALIAAATGIFVMITVLLVSEKEMVSELKKFFAAESVPAANGRNIVNVILVDFRALDTFGEITVLAIAAVGVFGLLKLTLWRKEG